MSSLVSDLGIGIVVFASTNIDDIFLLAAFFADPRLRHRSIVIGQYLGIGALVLVSALAALLALALPEGWVALLGVVPLLLGLSRLRALRMDTVGEDVDSTSIASKIRSKTLNGGCAPKSLPLLSVTSPTAETTSEFMSRCSPLPPKRSPPMRSRSLC